MKKLIDDFLWGLTNCDKVVLVLTGVGEREFSTKEIYEAIDELKTKADAYDKIMELTGTNDARLELTDKGAEELRPYLDKVKEVERR